MDIVLIDSVDKCDSTHKQNFTDKCDSKDKCDLEVINMKKAILSVSAAAAMIGGLFYFGWYRNRHGAN